MDLKRIREKLTDSFIHLRYMEQFPPDIDKMFEAKEWEMVKTDSVKMYRSVPEFKGWVDSYVEHALSIIHAELWSDRK